MSTCDNPFPDEQYKQHTFAKADMSECKFDGVNLSKSHYYAKLNNARFEGSIMAAVAFDDVNLQEASFENINLSSSTFHDINFSNTRISYANLSGVQISDVNLEGMTIDGILVSDLLNAYEKLKEKSDT